MKGNDPVREAVRLLRGRGDAVALTGAGISVESGIPAFRGSQGLWAKYDPAEYATIGAFLRDPVKVWRMLTEMTALCRGAAPNPAHAGLSDLEGMGILRAVITQNVDGLHQAAGSRNVIDLHGRIDAVRCLECGTRVPRADVQAELARRNPRFARLDARVAPDGDADLEDAAFAEFDVPPCHACGGRLKPDVVFFGEGVPKERVVRTTSAIERSDAMLVVGSSLMVYSGYRLALAMADAGKPVAAVNIGRTRADDRLTLKVEEDCAVALAFLLDPGGASRLH